MTVKISQLPAAGSVAGTDEFETNQAGTSRKATAAQIRAGLAASGAVGSSGLTMATSRLLGRTTASSGAVEEISVGSGLSLTGGQLSATGGTVTGTLLNVQAFTSSGTYTRTAGATRAVVIARGGGGGGAGYGVCGESTFSTNGGNGGTTSFGSHVSAGGGGGVNSIGGGTGGTGGTGAIFAIRGTPGVPAQGNASGQGAGEGGGASRNNNVAGPGNAGERGGGGSSARGSSNSGGGGQGEFALDYITSGLGATETVTIGAGGSGGSGAGGGAAGGAGGAGYVIVYEYS